MEPNIQLTCMCFARAHSLGVYGTERVYSKHCEILKKTFVTCVISVLYLSRDMCFPTCGILICVDSDEPVQPPDKLDNSK